MSQTALPNLPEPVEPPARPPTTRAMARVHRAVRNQVEWVERDLDGVLPPDHPARAVWGLLESMDLEAFYADIKAVWDHPGQPATDPRVLLALWVYATIDGVGKARELDRRCREHDAYRWLRGGVPLNYHLLADFRVAHQAAMDDLLTQIVGCLLAAEAATLSQVAQDGMRVRASAGAASFRRQDSLERCLVEALGAGAAVGQGAGAPRSGGDQAPPGRAGAGRAGAGGAGGAGAGVPAAGAGRQGTAAADAGERQAGAGDGATCLHDGPGGPGDEDA